MNRTTLWTVGVLALAVAACSGEPGPFSTLTAEPPAGPGTGGDTVGGDAVGGDTVGGDTAVAEAVCGNGIVEAGEGCDDGNRSDFDACPDGLAGSCQPAACGDGFVRTDITDPADPAYEACDEGADNSNLPDACRPGCVAPRCGDGILDSGESCDDGDGDNHDACPDGDGGTCRPAQCGDGHLRRDVTDPAALGYEACDAGEANADVPDAQCRTTCLPPRCGDGVVDTGEQCDDGNGDLSDACPDGPGGRCEHARCGDGYQRITPDPSDPLNEECDRGTLNSDSLADACRLDCVLPVCGDGVTDSGEGCDTGGARSDTEPDACRLDCQPARCGDGVVDPGSDDCDLTVRSGLSFPARVAMGPSGTFYVTDPEAGAVFVYDASLKRTAELGGIDRPTGIAVTADRIYVASDGQDLIHVYSLAGEHFADMGAGILQKPSDIALDADGNLYAADSFRGTVVVFDSAGTMLREIGQKDDRVAPLLVTELSFPAAVAVAYRGGVGELFVADQGNHRVLIFSLTGTILRGFGDATVDDNWQGTFIRLQSLAIDNKGRLHALDSVHNNVQVLDHTTAAYITHYGAYGFGDGQLRLPVDLVIQPTGHPVVTDAENRRVVRFDPVP